MKIVVTRIASACAALVTVGAATPALAQYQYDQPYYAVEVVPPGAVMTIVRSQGFAPISRPTLRGVFYVVRAVEEDRLAVRIVVDGRTGRIVRVTETGEWQDARFGAVAPPPGDILGAPPVSQDAAAAPKTSATRIPLPRPAPPPQTRIAAAPPPQTRPATTPPPLPPNMAAIVNEPAAPGKSVPAPVGERSADTTGSTAPATSTDQPQPLADTEAGSAPTTPTRSRSSGGLELKPTEMIPVAPLE